MHVLTVGEDPSKRDNTPGFIETVIDLACVLGGDVVVKEEQFEQAVPEPSQADLNIFGMASETDFEFVCSMVDPTRSSCLFVADSGQESALAEGDVEEGQLLGSPTRIDRWRVGPAAAVIITSGLVPRSL